MKRRNFAGAALMFICLMACNDRESDNAERELRSKLSGCWGELNDDHCALKFFGDSLVFGITNTIQRYDIVGDYIFIELPDKKMEFYSWFSVVEDTLFLLDLGDTVRGYRISNPAPTPPPTSAK